MRTFVVTVATAAVWLAMSVGAAFATARQPCPANGVRKLNREAVVYVNEDGYGACARRTGRRLDIGDPLDPANESPSSGNAGFVGVQLVGHFVLTEYTSYDDYGGSFSFEVINVLTGRTNYKASASSIRSSSDGLYGPRLGPRGSVLYLRVRAGEDELVAHDLGGTRVLDRGAGIHPRSLRITGHTARWVKARASRSAAMNN